MKNSERFLRAFKQIERVLKDRAPHQRQRPFYQLVEHVGNEDSLVRQLETDLKEYSDLRNAIIHERGGGHTIAEPNDQAVGDIESIARLISKPPTVIPLFETEVAALDQEQRITAALELILKRSISQVPIRRGRTVVGLLTTDTIARWLGRDVDRDVVSLRETPISAVLRHTEDRENHCIFPRSATVFEVIDLFQSKEHLGKRLDAILITNQGGASEDILGIVTISDLPKAFHAISRPYARSRGADR